MGETQKKTHGMKIQTLIGCWLVAGLLSPATLRAQALDYSKLTSLWRLNNQAADSIGTNNGTFAGQANYDAGPQAGTECAVLDGASYIKAGKGVAFETNNPFTATAWIKGPAQNSAILGRMNQGGTYTGWEFHAGDRAGALNVWIINQFGPKYIAVYGASQVLDDNWHHVAMSYDGSGTAAGVRIYVDGQDDTADTTADSLAGTIVAANAELCLGTRQSGANHNWKGSLSEVSLWKSVLTQAQILGIFQNGVHPPVAFAASAPETFAGLPVTLSWEADPAAQLVIDQGVGNVTAVSVKGKGSTQVSPEVATTYTITATQGASTQTKQVTVGITPLIVAFTASGTQVPRGVPVTFAWIAHPQARLSLSPGPGDLAGQTTNGVGSVELIPSQTTTYILKAQRGTSTLEASLNITIVETGMPDFSKLISCWPLKENTADAIGTNNGLFFGAQEGYSEGPRTNSGALAFDAGSWVTAGQGIAFDTSSPFSATAWINGPQAQDSAIVGRMRQGNGYTGWELHVGTPAGGSGPGKLNVWLINNFGSSYIQVNSPRITLDDTWHHVAFTYDGSGKAAGVKIYVDGQDATGEAAADNLNATILPEDAELTLGSRQSGANHNFRGSLSEVSVWGAALTPGNIVYIYKQGIPAQLPAAEIRLSGAVFTSPARFRFTWASVAGKTYRIEYSPDLKTWKSAAENYPAGGATTSYTNNAASPAALFYRVVQP
jgi:hypothetical protein